MWVSWLVGMVIMTWQVILGIRAIWGSWVSDFFAVNNIHKYLWIWSFSAIIIHPIAVLIAYSSSFLFLFERSFANKYAIYITAGRIARQLIVVVFLTSVIIRKFMKYKLRHNLHLLTYIAILLVWFHGLFTGTMIKWIPWVYVYWRVMGIILIIVTAYRFAFQYGFGKLKSQIISNIPLTNHIYELKIQLPKSIKYEAWQFVYIQVGRWTSSHPFTVAEYDGINNQLIIAYKKAWEYTHVLSNIKSWDIYMDGPYGNFGQIDNSWTQNIICFAGGIGITPFISLGEKYHDLENFRLIYLNQHIWDDIYHEKLSTKLKNKIVYIFSREKDKSKYIYTEEGYIDSRFNSEIFDNIVPKNIQRQTIYLLCWSVNMVKWITSMLIYKWISLSNIRYEPFNM